MDPKKENKYPELKNGSLLVSMPFMGDPNFDRTVILICEHSDDEGSFGLVLNDKSDFRLSDFDLFEKEEYDDGVFLGGPVQHNTIHFIHGYSTLKKAAKVRDNVYWGGDFDSLQEKIKDKEIKIENIRFYLGYSGWSAGQIGEELDRGSWVINNKYSTNIFSVDSDVLWKTIMTDMGGEYAQMANYPIDPSLN